MSLETGKDKTLNQSITSKKFQQSANLCTEPHFAASPNQSATVCKTNQYALSIKLPDVQVMQSKKLTSQDSNKHSQSVMGFYIDIYQHVLYCGT